MPIILLPASLPRLSSRRIAFFVLETINDATKDEATSEATLQFCPEAHAILSRVAEILRRPLPELLHGLLCEAAGRFVTMLKKR